MSAVRYYVTWSRISVAEYLDGADTVKKEYRGTTILSIINASCDGYNYNATSIRLASDARSTAYQRLLRSKWRKMGRWPAVRSHADLFIYLVRSAAAGRDVGRRMVVA